jgi:hypothetical protein
LPAAKQIELARARRADAQRLALKPLGHNPSTFTALVRRTDLGAAALEAEQVLTGTDARWSERLAAAHVASRGDLPSMMKAPPALDAAFPKQRIAERGTAVLASLGLYGLPRLTLDLTDGPKKQPLPLTVSGVRMSFKPRGGWKDQQALLAELGRALAMNHFAGRQAIETTAALFASLAYDRAWLEALDLSPALVAAAVELGKDLELFTLRRAAGSFTGQIDRAYQIPDDPLRGALDAEPLSAGLVVMRAHVAATALAAELGDKWWTKPESAERLRTLWRLNP